MVRSQPRWPQQCRSRLIDGLVDTLVTQPHPRLLGELQPQVTTDLLWSTFGSEAPRPTASARRLPRGVADDCGYAARSREGGHRTDGYPGSWSRCGAAPARPSKAPDPAGARSAGCSSPRDADRRSRSACPAIATLD